MNISSISRRLTLTVAGAAVLMALAGTAQAATSRPAGMSKAEYRALLLRSEALNKKYGLDAKSAKPAGMSAAAYRALMLRGQALNRKYGLGPQKAPSAVSVPPISTRAFAWPAFGIGAAAMLGFVLLIAGVTLASRAARHTSAVRTSS
jgi:hypothetical protein